MSVPALCRGDFNADAVYGKNWREGGNLIRRKESEESKKRILSACVRMFLEKGYNSTRMADILEAANVSNSTFQNIFKTKDGVLLELVRFMFDNPEAIKKFINKRKKIKC